MRILTEGKEGSAIVELNIDEMREFTKLIYAVEGKSIEEFINARQFRNEPHAYAEISVDLSSVFGAVRSFYTAKFRTNEIKQGLQILENSLRNND